MGLEERRKRERENRRNVILKAARKLFFDKGFRQVTVESIAHRAELSKGSIYLYFKSKEEIYSHILLTDIDKFYKNIENLHLSNELASDLLQKLARIYINFFLSDRELFRILMTFMLNTDHMNLPDDLNRHLIKATNKTISVVESIFDKGIASGEFSPAVNSRQNRDAVWGMLNGVISLYLFTGTESKREEKIYKTIQDGLAILIDGLKVHGQDKMGGVREAGATS